MAVCNARWLQTAIAISTAVGSHFQLLMIICAYLPYILNSPPSLEVSGDERVLS